MQGNDAEFQEQNENGGGRPPGVKTFYTTRLFPEFDAMFAEHGRDLDVARSDSRFDRFQGRLYALHVDGLNSGHITKLTVDELKARLTILHEFREENAPELSAIKRKAPLETEYAIILAALNINFNPSPEHQKIIYGDEGDESDEGDEEGDESDEGDEDAIAAALQALEDQRAEIKKELAAIRARGRKKSARPPLTRTKKATTGPKRSTKSTPNRKKPDPETTETTVQQLRRLLAAAELEEKASGNNLSTAERDRVVRAQTVADMTELTAGNLSMTRAQQDLLHSFLHNQVNEQNNTFPNNRTADAMAWIIPENDPVAAHSPTALLDILKTVLQERVKTTKPASYDVLQEQVNRGIRAAREQDRGLAEKLQDHMNLVTKIKDQMGWKSASDYHWKSMQRMQDGLYTLGEPDTMTFAWVSHAHATSGSKRTGGGSSSNSSSGSSGSRTDTPWQTCATHGRCKHTTAECRAKNGSPAS